MYKIKKLTVYGTLALLALTAILNFASIVRWNSIEAVTARYYKMRDARQAETERLNAIINNRE